MGRCGDWRRFAVSLALVRWFGSGTAVDSLKIVVVCVESFDMVVLR